MAELEVGEYFAILGEKKGPEQCLPFIFFPQTKNYEGIIFKAMQVNYTMVAAKVVFPQPQPGEESIRLSLNVQDLEIWPLTQEYVEVFGIKDIDDALPGSATN